MMIEGNTTAEGGKTIHQGKIASLPGRGIITEGAVLIEFRCNSFDIDDKRLN